MKRLFLTLAFVVAPAIVHAQTTPLPDPRMTVGFDYSPEWDQVYTAADGALNGQPFIQNVVFTISPVAPTTTGGRTVTVPHAQVVKNGTSLTVTDVPIPVGNYNVFAQFENGAGVRGGASNTVPFSLSRPAPPAPRNLRVAAQQP